MSKLFAIVLSFFAALTCTTPTLSQAQQTAKKTLGVAFYEAGYLYSNGQGIDKDVVDEIKNRGGYNFHYIKMSRARIWKELQDGNLSMSVSGIQNPARDKFSYFIPYIAQKNMALVTNTKYNTAESIVADKAAKIAVVRGFKHGDYFDEVLERIRVNNGDITEVTSVHNLFLMIKAGNRIDMMISLPVFYAKELKDLGIESKVIIHDWAPASKPIVHALILDKAHFSEGDVKKMQVMVDGMRKDGTLKRIFLKYLSEKDAEDALNF